MCRIPWRMILNMAKMCVRIVSSFVRFFSLFVFIPILPLPFSVFLAPVLIDAKKKYTQISCV